MLTRRQFMGLGIVALGGVVVSGEWWLLKSARDRQRLGRLACGLIREPEQQADLGRFCLARGARPPRKAALLNALFRTWRGPEDPTGEDVRLHLLRQMEADFARDRTVNYEGWILSETEARLCALLALNSPPVGP